MNQCVMSDTRENSPPMQFAHRNYITNRLDRHALIPFASQNRDPVQKPKILSHWHRTEGQFVQ